MFTNWRGKDQFQVEIQKHNSAGHAGKKWNAWKEQSRRDVRWEWAVFHGWQTREEGKNLCPYPGLHLMIWINVFTKPHMLGTWFPPTSTIGRWWEQEINRLIHTWIHNPMASSGGSGNFWSWGLAAWCRAFGDVFLSLRDSTSCPPGAETLCYSTCSQCLPRTRQAQKLWNQDTMSWNWWVSELK